MFIEFRTNKNELVSLNTSYILYVTEKKNGCVIFDIEGMDYTVAESYSKFMQRLNEKSGQKV